MTAERIMRDAWKMLGEPSDLNPNDVSGTGRSDLLHGLNTAIRAVAFYKDYTTKEQFRFNEFRREIYVSYAPVTGTAQVGGGVDTVVLSSLPSGITDLAGAIITIGGENRVIGSNVGVTCALLNDLSATSVGEAYTIYPRWVLIPAGTEFIEVLKVEDFTNLSELLLAPEEEDFFSQATTVGSPSSYYRIGRRIYFNTPPEEEMAFRIWLYRAPTIITQGTQTPELPESYHFAILLWLVYWGYQWENEPTDAYAAQMRFTNFMRTTRHELDLRRDMSDAYTLGVRAY